MIKRKPAPEGFSADVHALLQIRSGNRCERCGLPASDLQDHHRRPRGMGGSRRPDTNTASNAGRICGSCHRIVESYRSQAYDEGWLVKSSRSPLAVPILYRGQWHLLDDEGFVYRIPAPAGGVA